MRYWMVIPDSGLKVFRVSEAMGAGGSDGVGAGLLDFACDFARLSTCAGRSVGKLYFVVMRVWALCQWKLLFAGLCLRVTWFE